MLALFAKVGHKLQQFPQMGAAHPLVYLTPATCGTLRDSLRNSAAGLGPLIRRAIGCCTMVRSTAARNAFSLPRSTSAKILFPLLISCIRTSQLMSDNALLMS